MITPDTRHARAQLRGLSSTELERIHFGVAVVRRHGDDEVLEAANDRYLRGLPPSLRAAGLFGVPLRRLLPPSLHERVMAALHEARARGRVHRPVEEVAFSGAPVRYYRWTAVADPGDVDVVTFLVTDVTQAVHLQARTAVQEAERAAVTEGLRDGVVVMNANRRIRYANASARRLLSGRLVGERWTDVRERVGFERVDGVTRHVTVERALSGEVPEPLDVRFTVAGAEMICRASVQPLWLEGEVIGAAVVLSDVTAERRLAREREALVARELAVHEQVRDEVAGALHDSVLQTFAELAVMVGAAQARSAPVDADALLAVVDRGIAQCRRLGESLRPSRISDGVSSALAALLADWRERGLLEVELEGPALPRLEGWRETLLYQVAAEALRNALTHGRGSRVRLRQTVGQGHLTIEVRDEGPGMTEDDRRQAADAGHLGLILSRDRMTALGGAYALASAPGAGTTVTLTAPLA